MLREIEFWEYFKRNGAMIYEKGPMQRGKFHGIGFDFEEFESGPGNYSTCIIEISDGTLKNIPVENCRFVLK